MADLPKAIFKYVTPDRIDILRNLQIRFTQPSCFNDPFEAQFCIDGFEDEPLITKHLKAGLNRRYLDYVLSQACSGGDAIPYGEFRKREATQYPKIMRKVRTDRQSLREKAAERVQNFWDIIGILSLSATENNLLMWAHYTNSHAGMLIEFDARHPYFCRSGGTALIEFRTLVEVTYSDKRPRYRIGNTPDPIGFCTKSEDWHYENEWRVFRKLDECDSRVSKANETVSLFNLPPESVKRVIMGCRMSGEKRKELKAIVSANPTLRHVQLQQAKPDLDAFRLNYGLSSV